MTRQDRILHAWKQDGDWELMQKFFTELPQDGKKEQIKEMVLAKLEQEGDLGTFVQSDAGAAPVTGNHEQQRSSLVTRLKVAWHSARKRWGWKMVLPAMAVVLVVILGQAGLRGNWFLHSDRLASTGVPQTANSTVKGSMNQATRYGPSGPASEGDTQGISNGSAIVAGSGMDSSKSIAPGTVQPSPPVSPAPPADASLPRKITRNMSISLQVEDISAAVKKLDDLAASLGGYTAESQLDNQTDPAASARVTLKVSADKFAGISRNLATIGKVLNQHIVADDITNQYYDTDTRLRDWQAEEQRYLAILQKAKTVNEIMQVESSLSGIRMQIEQLKGQLKLWDNQVAYSTIQVQLQTKPDPVRVEDPWQPVAWHATWQSAKNAVIKTISVTWNLLNYLIVGIGYILPLLILAGAYWGYRRFFRK